MIHTLFVILAIYSISFAIKESSLLDIPRNWITRNSPFFYKLLSCYFCLSFYSGIIAYFLFNPLQTLSFKDILLWGLAGSSIGLIMNGIVSKLYKDTP